MIGVSNAVATAAKGPLRNPIAKVEAAWDKTLDASIGFFTLDVSTLDGPDVLFAVGEDLSDIHLYNYTDESDHLIAVEVEQTFEEPLGSFARTVANVTLDNIDGRYLPEGDSEIAAYIKVNRAFRISLGLRVNGVDELFRQFVGLNWQRPKIDRKSRRAQFEALDFGNSVWQKEVANTVMFEDTSITDIIESLLLDAGIIADQINLDPSEQSVPFAYFEAGTLLGEAIARLSQADLGSFYFDELGNARYRARDFFVRSAPPDPFTITDGMVISENDLEATSLINHVEVRASPRKLQSSQVVFRLGSPIDVPPGESVEFFVQYEDPVKDVIQAAANALTSSYYYANTDSSNNGIDYTSSVTITAWSDFGKTSKITFHNAGSRYAYVTDLVIMARPAKATAKQIVVVDTDQDSIDENGDQKIVIENDYIQSELRARNLAAIVLADRKKPASYRELTIIGQPQLQIGDMVSRNGQTYNILGLYQKISAEDGYIQRLKLVQNTIQTYFRLDISQLDGTDGLAP